ncbi:MAG TPA: hypothetical protein VJN92_01035 [Candidatus Acidoferrum sp.]|nr:hypothetical protein [Candidatus Acidoferrum sp.]
MKRPSRWFLRQFGRACVAFSLFGVILVNIWEARLYGQSQAQNPAPAQVRARAEETLEWWNQTGK